MAFVATVLAGLLDPVRFAAAFGVSFASRSKWIIPVAALASAATAETVLTLLQTSRTWGVGLLPGLLSSLILAVLCYRLVGWVRRKK